VKHFVYIIYSEESDRYYVGITRDVIVRLERHNDGWTRSTKGRGPWKLVYVEECESKTAALRREREIKKHKSRKYLEKLITSYSAK
jgi:putative endonuclease